VKRWRGGERESEEMVCESGVDWVKKAVPGRGGLESQEEIRRPRG